MNFQVMTQHPIALGSVDHLHPRGTKNDNSENAEFNRRLFALFPRRPSVLDLGCSGGGFVRSIYEMGGIAIGIEGSDYSQKLGRAEWDRIPHLLFTADVSKPFFVIANGLGLVTFDVVTMWEVLEHLTAGELELLNLNVHTHIRPGGYFIASINSGPDRFDGVDYHATVRPPAWWEEFFCSRGWRHRRDLFEHFHPHWVRGPNTEGRASTCFVFQK